MALALMASGSARWGACRSPESCPTSLMFTTLELGVEPGVETGGYMVRAVLSVWCSSFRLSSLWRVWRGGRGGQTVEHTHTHHANGDL